MSSGMRLTLSKNISLVDSEIFEYDETELAKWDNERINSNMGITEAVENGHQRADYNFSDLVSMIGGVSVER